ncbi:MAG: transporter substrate-binding protein [Herbinix sp.]|jgi:peptide/nickel transport system substrate-binding protein|nr:transporter substrate-binding protein [Herbinix sp.]
MKKRTLLLIFLLCLAFSFTACGSKKDDETNQNDTADDGADVDGDDTADADGEKVPDKIVATGTYDTLVVGTQTFNGVFSPMFSSNAYDVQAYDPVFVAISRLDKDGVLVDYAGHVEAKEQPSEDGSHTQVLYTVSVKEGMKFSDGEPVTIDDVIFQYYVFADPTYDGSSTFSTLDIVGLKEYYYDTPDYTAQIAAITADVESKYTLDKISADDYKAYLKDSSLDGWWQGIDSYDWVEYLKGEGYDPTGIETDADKLLEMLVDCEYTKYAAYYDPQSYYQAKGESEFITGNLEDGVDVDTIEGIKKLDEYTCTVLFDSVNIYGDREVAYLSIVPEHYYGKDFKKGDLSAVKALNGSPLGSGPYKFVSYQDNIVTLEGNPLFFGETPKIPTVKFQVTAQEDMVDALIGDQIDITDPSASQDVIDQIEEAGDSYSLVDNPGYGYIAVSAKTIPDINVRKGLMHLMNRHPAVESYYGDLAEVIERPMTPTVSEYPHGATEVYAYDPAKALEYFTTAGYAKDGSGKLVKDGEQLQITVGIGSSGTMNHPSAPILTQMVNDMAGMGAELIIQDIDFSTLTTKVDAGELDMWVMAWGNSTSCDLTQLFGSKGNDNTVGLYSDEVDALQKQILQTVDFDERCALVAQELDLIMDAAVYMPVYQRKNMEIYNASTINLETLPEETTTYWNYASQIYHLEMQ